MEVQRRIEARLAATLRPEVLRVINESANHSVPAGSETHFKVVVVSPAFDGLGRIERHRLVHGALADELTSGVHALTLTLRTPSEWQTAEGARVEPSPPCLGGSKAG